MNFRLLKISVLFYVLIFVFGCTEQQPPESPTQPHSSCPENGYLIAAGGNLTDTAVFKKFMELSGGPDEIGRAHV